MECLPPPITNNDISEKTLKRTTLLPSKSENKTEFKEGNRISAPIPLWILTIDKESGDTELFDNLKEILYTKVRIEAYKGLTGVIKMLPLLTVRALCSKLQEGGEMCEARGPPQCKRLS